MIKRGELLVYGLVQQIIHVEIHVLWKTKGQILFLRKKIHTHIESCICLGRQNHIKQKSHSSHNEFPKLFRTNNNFTLSFSAGFIALSKNHECSSLSQSKSTSIRSAWLFPRFPSNFYVSAFRRIFHGPYKWFNLHFCGLSKKKSNMFYRWLTSFKNLRLLQTRTMNVEGHSL